MNRGGRESDPPHARPSQVLQVAFALKGELAAPVALALKAHLKKHKLQRYTSMTT